MAYRTHPGTLEAYNLMDKGQLIVCVSAEDDPQKILEVADIARSEFEYPLMEVWDRNDNPEQTIKIIRALVGKHLHVLIGTVESKEQLVTAMESGAEGMVSNYTDPALIERAMKGTGEGGILTIPGIGWSGDFLGIAAHAKREAGGMNRFWKLPPEQRLMKSFPAKKGNILEPQLVHAPPPAEPAPNDWRGFITFAGRFLRDRLARAVLPTQRAEPTPSPQWKANDAGRRLVGTVRGSVRWVFTGFDDARETAPWLEAYPDAIIAPKITTREELIAYADVIAAHQNQMGREPSRWTRFLARQHSA